MEDWKKGLRDKLQSLVTSRHIGNYETAIIAFRNKYNELIDDFKSKAPSLFEVRNHKGNVYFYIHKHALSLIDEGAFVKVVARDESGELIRTPLAEIRFEEDFSYLYYQEGSRRTGRVHLNYDNIEALFQEAYAPLISPKN